MHVKFIYTSDLYLCYTLGRLLWEMYSEQAYLFVTLQNSSTIMESIW